MPRIVRQILYYGMFPAFIAGAVCFYLFLRVRLVFAPRGERTSIARRVIHHGARLLFFSMRALSLVRVTLEHDGGGVHRSGPAVVVANHPSMLDAMLLLSLTPNGVCIMKRSLMRVPVIAGFARVAGYVPYAEAPEMFREASGALATGASLIIFPEGSRSPEGSLREFRRGAARIAVQACVPIELFTLEMDPVVLGSQQNWLTPPTTTVRYRAVRMNMGEVEMEQVHPETPEEVREESVRLTRYLEERVRSSLFSEPKLSIPGAL